MAYELSTEELNGLLEAATPVAMAAVGVRTEEKINAVYGMSASGDTNRDTLETGKAGKGCIIFFSKNTSLQF